MKVDECKALVCGIAPTTEDFQLRSLVALAKWLYGGGASSGGAINAAANVNVNAAATVSAAAAAAADAPPPCVLELVRVQRTARQRSRNAPHAADEARKWLDWPAYLRLVRPTPYPGIPVSRYHPRLRHLV